MAEPFGLAPGMDEGAEAEAARAAAALRMRRSAIPPEGRQEGAATRGIELLGRLHPANLVAGAYHLAQNTAGNLDHYLENELAGDTGLADNAAGIATMLTLGRMGGTTRRVQPPPELAAPEVAAPRAPGIDPLTNKPYTTITDAVQARMEARSNLAAPPSSEPAQVPLRSISSAEPQLSEPIRKVGPTEGNVTKLYQGGTGKATPLVIAAENNQGIRAYHGSPHDFDRFDLSRIGTGEGAQSYGHGLYFAENPKVAQAYRENLSPHNYANPEVAASAYLKEFGGDRAAALAAMRKHAADPFFVSDPAMQKGIREGYQLLKNDKFRATDLPPPGRMYEVNINAKPEQFLDWDKPLSAQNSDVRAVFEKHNLRPKDVPPFWMNDAANQLAAQDGSWSRAAGARNVSDKLRDAGIPGIKYLDQGSRAPGVGSSNYVVFNDKLINILKKYGIVLPGATVAAGQAFGSLAPGDRK